VSSIARYSIARASNRSTQKVRCLLHTCASISVLVFRSHRRLFLLFFGLFSKVSCCHTCSCESSGQRQSRMGCCRRLDPGERAAAAHASRRVNDIMVHGYCSNMVSEVMFDTNAIVLRLGAAS
jgi:hypothetical protein